MEDRRSEEPPEADEIAPLRAVQPVLIHQTTSIWSDILKDQKYLISATAFALFLIKALGVARFSPVPAMTVIQASGLSVVLTGIALTSLPWLPTYGLVLLMIKAESDPRWWISLRYRRQLCCALVGLGVALGGLLYSAIVAALSLLVGILMWVSSTMIPRVFSDDEQEVMPTWRQLKILAVAIILAIGVASGPMWLPAERIRIAGQGETIAYVLADDQGWTTLLVEQSRSIQRVRSDDIKTRTVCTTASPRRRFFQKPLMQVLDDRKPAAKRQIFPCT